MSRTAHFELVVGRVRSLADRIATALAGFIRGRGRFLAPVGTMLAAFFHGRAKFLAPVATALAGLSGGRRRLLAYVGAALALAGIGIVTVAAATTSPAASPAAVSSSRQAGGPGHGFAVNVGDQAGRANSIATTSKPAVKKAPAHTAATSKPAHKTAARKPAAHKAASHKAAPSRPTTWKQVRDRLAAQTYPKPAPHKLPLPDRLLPGTPSGGQSYLPITGARLANATTIVRQALHRHMGVRSAVIAVATAMQESTLENITYGDRDSLGLFQQRPSCGWGSAAQITNPAYAANAFLSALHSHQAADPHWASQPLWATAQAVQASGFPTAYAKWESQAAQLVQKIAWHMV